jgi:hypothetical protein
MVCALEINKIIFRLKKNPIPLLSAKMSNRNTDGNNRLQSSEKTNSSIPLLQQ